jgi:hypothetical protein
VSGRRRFNCYSDASVEAQGEMMYRKIMRDERANILPDYDPRVKKVHAVMERLIPTSGLEDTRWELHVIESPGMFPSPRSWILADECRNERVCAAGREGVCV